jgi:hypothetical protein
MVKASHAEREALLATGPGVFAKGWTSSSTAWVSVRLPAADPEEVRELVTEAWLMTATNGAVAAFLASG